ncbi:TetR/AcrR family transcriptional regulator [Haloechinothrix sp. LS1_15]|uniref:TetR/AcrR family transcriptional regulator n=1 Tax=Haloechinothrix sp. LS1_15 TaxID=2652248 RepID=UPI002944957C|nr:TetR/AcrR family transcriptional regulator [Haloechinothrix sp. LS1_15]MDV6014064.1 TetR/AcrR family transcriptional regulator [Haloechinothrix sp. LS1_15]
MSVSDPQAVRRPQQERSRTTRRRLLEAAASCLPELGWTRTTVAVVAERAGVSRGAAQHHFPTREDLVSAAVQHISEVQVSELADKASSLPAGPLRTEVVVEMLLDLYTGPTFRAALHLWVAASTDQQLGALVRPLEAQVGREAHRTAVALFGVDETVPGVRETVQATLDLARGLGLANLLSDDSARRRKIAKQWSALIEPALSAAVADTG